MLDFLRQAVSVVALLSLPISLAAAGTNLVRKAVIDPTEIDIARLIEIPVVVTPSGFPQNINLAPASVSVVTTNEIKKFGYRTLAELLSGVRGLYVSYNRNNSFLGIRGFSQRDYNSRMLVMVDGHRINNNITDGALIGTDFVLDVDMIDRVEIVRGPGSVLYGNNAFFGVINVITRRGRDMAGYGGEVSGEYGSFDMWKGRFTWGHRSTNGVELMLSGSYSQSEGAEDLYIPYFNQPPYSSQPVYNHGIAHRLDSDNYGNFFGSLSFQGFTLQGVYHDRDKGIPTDPQGLHFNDPRYRVGDGRQWASLTYSHEFENVAHVTAKAYYDNAFFDNDWPSPNPTSRGTFPLYRDKMRGEWAGGELQLTRKLFDRHTVTVGAEYRDDFRQERFSYFDDEAQAIPRNLSRTRQSHGIYVEGDFALVTNRQSLHLNAGVRYDQVSSFDPSYSPRLALLYNPVGRSVFKAIYGTAFRAPNFLELIDLDPRNVKPEKVASYELVYEQGFGKHIRSTLSGFFSRVDDLITYKGYFTNFDAMAHGIGVGLDWTSGGWQAGVNYNWQQTRDETTAERLTDSPEHVAKAFLSVPLWDDKIFASLEYQYLSRRTTAYNSILPVAPGASTLVRGEDAAGYGVFNFTLFSRELVKGLEFSASVYNLLDKKYSDPSKFFDLGGTLPRDGRTFRVKLTYRF